MHDANRKTTVDHWDGAWQACIRLRLPSSLDVGTRNAMRLLRRYVKPGMHVLEIGFAPGKLLSWTAAVLGASVAGLDYSATGMRTATELFKSLGLKGDLRCEDLFDTTFEPGSFDFVCSFGLIEHFDDPREIVRRHVMLTKPGGVIVITIPNYGGLYGRIQRHFNAENLDLHNLKIMNPVALSKLAPLDALAEVQAFEYGRMSPWLTSFDKKYPRLLARGLSVTLNGIGLLQPFDLKPLSPLIVLKMMRRQT
jgi:2-polyprenyl-3-methyl-5-hydroxy-6-metoxy-1,4-benzoquinol methylase